MLTTRRLFLRLTAVAGTIPIVTLRPLDATPAMFNTAIRNVVGEAQLRTGKVRLDIPPLVENGNTVPMTVSVTSPMTPADYVRSIHVFNEKNPQPNIGNFYLGPWAARRFRPAFASPTARRWWRSRACLMIPSGRSPPTWS